MLPLAPLAATAVAGAGKALVSHLTKGVDATLHAGKTGLTGKTGQADKARKTADDFETMFLEQTVDRMTATGSTDGPLGANGTGGDVYRSMLSQQYAKQIGQNGGVGISDQVYGAIIKMQEAGGGGRG